MVQVSSLNTSYRMFQGIGIVQGTRFRVTMKACGAIKKQKLSGFAASRQRTKGKHIDCVEADALNDFHSRIYHVYKVSVHHPDILPARGRRSRSGKCCSVLLIACLY